MSQAILEIVFKTVNNGQGGKAAAAELKELKGTVGELTSGLTGLNLGSLSAAGAVVAVGTAAAKAVTDYQAYAEQIRGLSAITGTGAEQTSRLVQAFDDLGVTQEQFATLANGAAKKGFVMTIDNVAALADKYNTLGTQEEKNKLLTDNLGKSALEAAKAFEAGGSAIKAAAAEQAAGMIITEKQAIEAEKLRVAQDKLNDSWKALSNTVAQNLVPALTEAVDAANSFNEISAHLETAGVGTGRGALAMAQSQMKNAEANDAAAEAVTRNYTAMARYYEATENSNRATHEAAAGWSALPASMQSYITQTDIAAKATEELSKKIDNDLNVSMKAYNTQLQYQIASEGLSAENKAKLALSMGLIDEKSRYAIVKTQEWKELLDKNMITVEEYNRRVAGLANSLQRIESKDVTIAIHYVQTGDPRGSQRWGGETDGGSANGGTFTVPSGYPADSFTLGLTSGETVSVVNDRMRSTGSGSSGGSNSGISIASVTIQISGAGNPSAVADAVAFQLASLGKKFQGT